MTQYGVDDRSNGVPESECLFVVMDAGEECIDVFPTRAEAIACIEKDRAKDHPYIADPILLVVPRWGRTIDRDALTDDDGRYTAVLWPDGKASEVWADDEHDAAEHGFRA